MTRSNAAREGPSVASGGAARTSGCRAMRCSSAAMAAGASTWSTQPVAIAWRGMLVWAALSSWAKAMPPAALISSSPSEPSLPIPDRMMAMAFDPCSLASERRKSSTGR